MANPSKQYRGQEFAPVAMVGVACRLPNAANVEQYWDLLLNKRSAIAPLPNDVLDAKLFYHSSPRQTNSTYSLLRAQRLGSLPMTVSLSLGAWI